MFLLPNGNNIDDDAVNIALEDSEIEHHHFLNTETGEVECVSEMFDDRASERLEQIEEDKRFVPIPQISTHERYQWMEDYNEQWVKRRNRRLYENW